MTACTDQLDRAFALFNAIRLEVAGIDKSLWNEAETRLKVIDKILYDVLAWRKLESVVEEQAGSGYTDYTLRFDQCSKMIVEAKRDNVSFETENRNDGRAYKLNGPAFSAEAKSAINQAIIEADGHTP